MRDKVLIALLSVCCTLLAVNMGALWQQGAVNEAYGQAGGGGTEGGGVIVATVGTQNESMCYIYHTESKHLVAYSARGNGGIKVSGVRNTEFDNGFDEVNKHFTVKQARANSKKP